MFLCKDALNVRYYNSVRLCQQGREMGHVDLASCNLPGVVLCSATHVDSARRLHVEAVGFMSVSVRVRVQVVATRWQCEIMIEKEKYGDPTGLR